MDVQHGYLCPKFVRESKNNFRANNRKGHSVKLKFVVTSKDTKTLVLGKKKKKSCSWAISYILQMLIRVDLPGMNIVWLLCIIDNITLCSLIARSFIRIL